MKVCEVCSADIDGQKDGDNICPDCERKERRKANRKDREEVLKSLGLKKVKGNLGGTYWE